MFKDLIKCAFGMHEYEILREEDYNHLSYKECIKIGTCIISRCKHCGRIKVTKVKTIDSDYE